MKLELPPPPPPGAAQPTETPRHLTRTTEDALLEALESDETLSNEALDELGERCRKGSAGNLAKDPPAEDDSTDRLSFHYTRLALSPLGITLWIFCFSWYPRPR